MLHRSNPSILVQLNNHFIRHPKTATTIIIMEALTAYGSDDSSSLSSSNSKNTNLNIEEATAISTTTTLRIVPVVHRTTNKRQCVHEEDKITQQEQQLMDLFPPPCLSNKDSMIAWSNDYTVLYRRVPLGSTISSTGTNIKHNVLNIQKMNQQQHEFRNPSFFNTVVIHFGITNELGTHVNDDNEQFEEYEYHIIEVEEQERRKQMEREQYAGMMTTCTSSAIIDHNFHYRQHPHK